jgi:hypothetical protein
MHIASKSAYAARAISVWPATPFESLHLRRSSLVLYFPHIDKDTKDILETVNFIKDHMVTKADFDDAVEKLDGRLTAVESKIGGIHIRIDDEALKRGNLEKRVRSVVPNLPPPPERV